MKHIKTVWKILKNIIQLNKQPLFIRRLFQLYIFVALFASLLANKEPLFMSQNGEWAFPAFQSSAYIKIQTEGQEKIVRRSAIDWRTLTADMKIFAPVPYDANSSDLANYNYASPFDKQWQQTSYGSAQLEPLAWRYRHWLGTTKTGADVLAGLIYSTRLSLLIGFLSILITMLIGITIGSLAGYYGDAGIKVSKKALAFSAILFVPAYYYIFILPNLFTDPNTGLQAPVYFSFLKILLFLFIMLLPFALKRKSSLKKLPSYSINLPVDTIVSRFIELFLSVPRLILIITLAAISRPSVLA